MATLWFYLKNFLLHWWLSPFYTIEKFTNLNRPSTCSVGQNKHITTCLMAKWKQSFAAKAWLIYYPKLRLYYQASDSLVVEKWHCTFSWLAPRAPGQMETQRFNCFCVMEKELAHLWVSVLHMTHNPISVSSQSLSDISTQFFFHLSLFIGDLFRFIPSQIPLQCFHTIYKEETSVAFSSPHSLLRLPHFASPTEGGKPHFEGRFEILIKSLVSFWMT